MSRDLRGERFGKLTVQSLEISTPWSKRSWRCRCDCGNECIRLESTLFKSLKAQSISSCGCLQKKNLVPGDRERCVKAGSHRKDAFVNGSNTQLIFRPGTVSTNRVRLYSKVI